MKNLGKDMKMKTPVEMMNSMVRKTRLARAVVLLGVGLVGTAKVGAEDIFYQKIIDSYSYTDEENARAHYYQVDKRQAVELGEVTLNEGEELSYNVHYIQREAYKGDYVQDGYWTGIIILTVKYPEFDQELEIIYNNQSKGAGKWSVEDGGLFFGGYFPVRGPAIVKVEIIPYAIRIRQGNNYHTHYPKQNWRVILDKTKATYAKSPGQQQVLVLPKGSGVNELVLESSEDLVNWEKDTLGDKNTDSGNRFYRLRAVKK
jgi:hypothetical protein